MNNKLKSEESYLYELKLNNEYVNETCFIKGNINIDSMKDLIFYIQYKYYDILPHSILTPVEFQEILAKCYGIDGVSSIGVDQTIDLYWNFKENFNKEKIENIMNNYRMYEAKGMMGELRKILDLTIEQWR